MAALSLGVDELERRLELVRQRLNFYTLQDALYRGGGAVLGGAALALIANWWTEGRLARPLRWAFLPAAFAVMGYFALRVRTRWLSLAATAELADRQAGLDCRLSTMLAHRNTAARSRLRGLLLAEVFLLASRWTPARLAPRRVPRSLAGFLAALALFGLAGLLTPREPDREDTAATDTGGERVAALSQQSASGSETNGKALVPSSRGAVMGEGGGTERSGSAARETAGGTGQPRQGDGGGKTGGDEAALTGTAAASDGERVPRGGREGSGEEDGAGKKPHDPADRGAQRGEQTRDHESRGADKRDDSDQGSAASRATPDDARKGEGEKGGSSRTGRGEQTPRRSERDGDHRQADRRAGGDDKGGSKAHDGGRGSEAEKSGLFAANGKKDADIPDAAAMLIKLTAFSAVAPDEFEKQGGNAHANVTAADGEEIEDEALVEQSNREIPLVRAPLAAEHEAVLRDIYTPRQ